MLEFKVKYRNIKFDIYEREKTIQARPDAHMVDIIRFIKK